MKTFKFPNSYVIIFSLIVIATILTWVVPSGKYSYKSVSNPTIVVTPKKAATMNLGKKYIPIAGTYSKVSPRHQSVYSIFTAPIIGFKQAVGVAMFILIIGGFLGIIMHTKSIETGISRLILKLRGKEKWIIPILMLLFGLGGSTFGMSEETLAFYPILIPIMLIAGYDTITVMGIVMLGSGVGVLAATVDPFATAIASNFANTSLGNGIFLRMIMWIILELTVIVIVMRYASKVKADPSKSIVADLMPKIRKSFLSSDSKTIDKKIKKLTIRQILVLITFILTFVVMIYGVIPFNSLGITAIPTLNWWFTELSALFFASSIVMGIIYKINPDSFVDQFIKGSQTLLGVALIVGLTRGINVIMDQGLITDTVLHWGEIIVQHMSSNILFINAVYLVEIVMSFLIPSTSGLAVLTMPILAPVAEFTGVSKSLVVTAYQSASGIVNLFTPTAGVIMGALILSKIPFTRWFRFVWPTLLIIFAITIVLISLATYI